GDERGSDQDGFGEPHRSRGRVQPAAAYRRRARWSREVRGEIRAQGTAVMPTLVLLRHGESIWNKENRFTGWTDVDLTETGRDEAARAGDLMKEGGYIFDIVYTSVLTRAIRTMFIALDRMTLLWIPV